MKTVLTQKHQVHIPQSIRRIVGLEAHSSVYVSTDGTSVLITPVKQSVLDLAGTFAVEKPIKAEAIRTHLSYGQD